MAQEQMHLPSPYASWLGKELLRITDNWKLSLPYSEEDYEDIVSWIVNTKPEMHGLTIEDSFPKAIEWSKERKAMEVKYKTHDVIYEFNDGWKVVKLSEEDIKPENTIMSLNMNEREERLYSTISPNFAHDFIGQHHQISSRIDNTKETVEKGIYQIFSLRNPQNIPQATMEIITEDGDIKKSEVLEVYVNKFEDVEDKHHYNREMFPEREKIKQFFDYLKSQGYVFKPLDYDNSETIKVNELRVIDQQNEYGLNFYLPGIGGTEDEYYDNLMNAYEEGVSGSQWYESRSKRIVDDILDYAENRNELDKVKQAVEGFSTKAYNKKGELYTKYQSLDEWSNEAWFENETNLQFENERPDEDEYPDKEDFMTIDSKEEQPELQGMPPPHPLLDEERYNKALNEYKEKEEAYEEELRNNQEYFEPLIFSGYVWEELNKRLSKGKTEENKEVSKEGNTNLKMHKIAIKDEEIPKADVLATYVESLKMHLKKNSNLDPKLKDLIGKMASPTKIRKDYSIQECKILYETVEYLWKKITGKKIIQEEKIQKAPESLFGNYWLIKNGILLHGLNHYGIIKQNASLIATLLNLNQLTLQQYLSDKPHKIIEYILKNGGVRLFINKNKRLQAQMSSQTYGKWGKHKIKKYDFPTKIVRIIDFKVPYEGWKSGIPVKLR